MFVLFFFVLFWGVIGGLFCVLENVLTSLFKQMASKKPTWKAGGSKKAVVPDADRPFTPEHFGVRVWDATERNMFILMAKRGA